MLNYYLEYDDAQSTVSAGNGTFEGIIWSMNDQLDNRKIPLKLMCILKLIDIFSKHDIREERLENIVPKALCREVCTKFWLQSELFFQKVVEPTISYSLPNE